MDHRDSLSQSIDITLGDGINRNSDGIVLKTSGDIENLIDLTMTHEEEQEFIE